MERVPEMKKILASLSLEGQVLASLKPRDEIYHKYFAGWDMPLTPLGGFNLDPGLAVIMANFWPGGKFQSFMRPSGSRIMPRAAAI